MIGVTRAAQPKEGEQELFWDSDVSTHGGAHCLSVLWVCIPCSRVLWNLLGEKYISLRINRRRTQSNNRYFTVSHLIIDPCQSTGAKEHSTLTSRARTISAYSCSYRWTIGWHDAALRLYIFLFCVLGATWRCFMFHGGAFWRFKQSRKYYGLGNKNLLTG